jgi:uncharacterized protein (TIGR00661 family)
MLGGLAYYFSPRNADYFVISHHFLFESPSFIHPDNFPIQKKLLSIHNRICAIKAARLFALSFDSQPEFGSTRIMPPLIRRELIKGENKSDGFVLVYLLHEGLSVDLLPIFKKYPDINFSLFMNPVLINHVFPSNVDISAPDNNEFVKKLLTCSAVITTSGFETICEAYFLNKPVYIIPSENHYEQHGNFKDAIRTGIARSYRKFEPPGLRPRDNHKFVNWCKLAEEKFLQTILN